MVWGVGYVFIEVIYYYIDFVSFVNFDFGEYYIVVNRDIVEVIVDFIDLFDFEVLLVGVKGIGELGIIGVGVVIVNVIFDVIGVCVWDFLIMLDKVFEGLNKKVF